MTTECEVPTGLHATDAERKAERRAAAWAKRREWLLAHWKGDGETKWMLWELDEGDRKIALELERAAFSAVLAERDAAIAALPPDARAAAQRDLDRFQRSRREAKIRARAAETAERKARNRGEMNANIERKAKALAAACVAEPGIP